MPEDTICILASISPEVSRIFQNCTNYVRACWRRRSFRYIVYNIKYTAGRKHVFTFSQWNIKVMECGAAINKIKGVYKIHRFCIAVKKLNIRYFLFICLSLGNF